MAMALPMPRAAPVTTATFPTNRSSFFILVVFHPLRPLKFDRQRDSATLSYYGFTSSIFLAILVFQSSQIKTLKDLSYYDGPGADPRKHRLDLYLPAGSSGFPLAIFVHGGSWSRGDKDDRGGAYGILGRALVQRGIGVAVINYRLSPEVRHPEHARDVARAAAWLYKNSGPYGWSRNALFLIGHSAGGHLSSLIAVDPSYLAEQNLNPAIIRGVAVLSGVYDLTMTGVTGQSLYESVFTTEPEKLKSASPALNVKRRPPAFLLLYAQDDYLSADFQARRFEKAIVAAGGRATTQRIDGRNHVTMVAGLARQRDAVYEAVVTFIKQLTTDK